MLPARHQDGRRGEFLADGADTYRGRGYILDARREAITAFRAAGDTLEMRCAARRGASLLRRCVSAILPLEALG